MKTKRYFIEKLRVFFVIRTPAKLACSVAALALLVTATVSADFLCRAEVSYTWARASDQKEVTSFFSAVEGKGSDEAAAKLALEDELLRQKQHALQRCSSERHNEAACIAAKYSSMQTTLLTLGFSARKALEASIGADCKARSGVCGEAKSSEAVCREVVVSGATSATGATDAGKDAKGAKEKKKK